MMLTCIDSLIVMLLMHDSRACAVCQCHLSVYNFAGVFTLLVEDFGKNFVKLFDRLVEIIIH